MLHNTTRWYVIVARAPREYAAHPQGRKAYLKERYKIPLRDRFESPVPHPPRDYSERDKWAQH